MNFKFTYLVVFGLFINFVSLNSHADQMGPNGDKFYEIAARLENACQQVPCARGFSQQNTYNYHLKINALKPAELKKLKSVAKAQSRFWSPEHFNRNLQLGTTMFLNEVITMFQSNNIIGYKIKYSTKAWDLDSCSNRSDISKCTAGRIYERSYVSADFQTFFSDEDSFAQFRFDYPTN